MCHLKVSVDDGWFALVQTRNGITGVTEDLQHLSLGEAGLQPLVHQVDHLPPWKIRSTWLNLSFLFPNTFTQIHSETESATYTLILSPITAHFLSALTLAVVHKYENLPYIPWSHSCNTGVQITNNILVTDKVFLQEHKHTFKGINKPLCIKKQNKNVCKVSTNSTAEVNG